ncbi:concanavalin A-like lectin/glucanase superfamily protein [Solirubrobacter pauli]|uniref:Concanavalin A-like lectin/glucanase superfamily protein n=2 Tax=Solirubrobacter pauli TaxID=166793 RepID=A0A660LJC4_9ACTN|nr:concanavalin A-like lectin/glucanase superfamily protein [Solirubrobacter pauli]
MSGRRAPRRAAALLVAGLTGMVIAPPSVSAAPSTAWVDNAFRVDTPNVVRRANIVLGSPPLQANQLMPLGNGTFGAAVWGAGGFTAQLNRGDTWPTRKSPGQVTIPGLAPLTNAADYRGSVDLYDATFRQSGGGMTATTYVRADKDQLVVDVTGADPNSTQTARINLQSGRNPTAGASDGIARLAETWVDTGSFTGGTGKTFGSLAAVTAGGREVSARVVDARTVEVSFKPNADGTFRVLIGSPSYNGGDAQAAAAGVLGSDTTGNLRTAHLAWWQQYWNKVGLIRLQSADGTADYMENLRTIFLYVQGASERGEFPTGQAGTNPLFNFSRDSQGWGGGHYWHWNMRMHLAANMGAGNTDANLPRYRLYRDNLENIRKWTTERMGGRPGICVPETMRFDGTGWYTGTDDGNPSCIAAGPPEWNRRNLTTGANVSLSMWRHYLATDDRTFLERNYPFMADAARFLLAYAVEGADGKLHTSPSNAHETQWDVSDPITDRLAMKTLFPIVVEAATLLGQDAALVTQLQAAIPKILDLPTETRNGQTAFAYSAQPLAQLRNVENLDLETVFPFNTVTDQTPAEFELAKASYATRRFVNANDWSLDAVDAARLHNGPEVAARLRATTSSYQIFSNGLANLGPTGATNTYDEHAGVTALAINEALATDFDGIVRIAPAVPPGWTAEGTVFLQHRSKISVQVQEGAVTTAALVNGPAARSIRIKNPWPGQEAQIVSGSSPGTVVVPATTAALITLPAAANGTYLIQRPSAPTSALPTAVLTGAAPTEARHLAGSNARIGIDVPGYEPPGPCPTPTQTPLFAWDPSSGNTIDDASGYDRDGVWAGGAASYLATGPTGSSASIDGPRYLRTNGVATLGYLREATWAAEIKINASNSYRRIWDWKTPSGGDSVGFLIDLTPSGQVRIITSGVGVTTNAVLPTGRFINLVITASRSGEIDVYVDGTRVGGGSIPNLAIDGCAPAELRIGADQGGGQRISAEVDRTAMFTKALGAEDRGRWQALAFTAPGESVTAETEISGSVPQVLSLAFNQATANLGTFKPGVTADYTATLDATVTSTAPNAALTVHDASATAPGHLVQGSYVLPQALQVRAGAGAFAPVGGASAPTPLVSYTGPKSLDAVAIALKQPIAATDGLHTGAYGKTLTFTLSTTTP